MTATIDMEQFARLPCYLLSSVEFGRMMMLAETLQQEIHGLRERQIRFTRRQEIAMIDMEAAIDTFIMEINGMVATILDDIERAKGGEQ